MSKDFPRTRRVADQMQRELAGIISSEIKDPRIGLVTLTGVDVSPDYAQAKVFFTRMGDAPELEAAGRALNRAAGFLRAELGRRMSLRGIPRLFFVFDPSVARGSHMSTLIDRAIAEDAHHEGGAGNPPVND